MHSQTKMCEWPWAILGDLGHQIITTTTTTIIIIIISISISISIRVMDKEENKRSKQQI